MKNIHDLDLVKNMFYLTIYICFVYLIIILSLIILKGFCFAYA